MKIGIIGAGSSYVPILVEALIGLSEEARPKEICLFDINPESRDIIHNFCKEILKSKTLKTFITVGDSILDVLDDAFAIFTIYRVGDLEARHHDEISGVKRGLIGQETQGLGGALSALRNVPVVVDLAQQMSTYASNTWLLNITNPVGIITRASMQFHTKVIGICELPLKLRKTVAHILNVPPKDVRIDYMGLNHLGWILDAYVGEQSVMKSLLEKYWEPILRMAKSANIPISLENLKCLRSLRAIPNPYLAYFYCRNLIISQHQDIQDTRARQCIQLREKLMRMYKDKDLAGWQEVIYKRGGYLLGEAAAQVIRNLCSAHETWNDAINICNQGIISELPDEAVIEIPCLLSNTYIKPAINPRPLPSHMMALLASISYYEAEITQAAIEGNINHAVLALAAHPLVGDIHLAMSALEDSVSRFHNFLPQFQEKRK